MLAGAVYACKRLFVQQANKAVFFGCIAENFHNHHIVVDGKVEFFEYGSYFKLRWSNFVVARFSRDSYSPKLLVDIVHKTNYARLY